ncbi:MAG: AraC family transcriptional regulator [Sphingobium sp.]|nr:AraC family transcriptional regulator [Sphingobium sp.]
MEAEQFWIRANVLAPVADALAREGRSIHVLLDRHPTATWKIHNSYQEIPLRDYFAFLEDAAEFAEDPFFGLRLGAKFRPESFGVIGNVFRSSTNVRSALARLAAYLCAVRGGTRVEFIVQDEGADWIYAVEDDGILQRRQDVEFSLAATCGFVRALLGSQWTPVAVHFEHAESDAKPRERQVLSKFFQAPVLFGQKTNKLVLHERDLDRMEPHGRNAAAPYMERYFRELVAEANGGECIANQVRYLIARRIGHAALNLGSLASELGMSGRSLQRRLAEEGLSLRALVTEQRTIFAEALLSRETIHVSTIAQNLGYSDPAVLSRAFKLWKGSSPSAFRKQRAKLPD